MIRTVGLSGQSRDRRLHRRPARSRSHQKAPSAQLVTTTARRGAGTGGWGSSCVLKAGSARPKTVPPRRESKPAPREGGRSPSPRQLLALSEEEAPRALDTCRPRCSRHGRPPPPLRPPQAEGPSDRPPAHSWHPALFAQQRVCQTHFSWFQPLYKTDSSDFSSLFWHRGKKM